MHRRVVIELAEPLLEATDNAANEMETNRSEVIRAALREYLAQLERRKMEKELEEGYIANAESARTAANDMMGGESGL